MLPRSAVPRVVGILALVIAPIGMLWSWTSLRRSQHMAGWEDVAQVADTITYLQIFFGVSVALFLAHAAGGVFACAYRKIGRHLLNGYAIVALALIVVDFYMLNTLPSGGPRHDRHGFGSLLRFVASVIAVPWPILVLVLMNLRRSREALR